MLDILLLRKRLSNTDPGLWTPASASSWICILQIMYTGYAFWYINSWKKIQARRRQSRDEIPETLRCFLNSWSEVDICCASNLTKFHKTTRVIHHTIGHHPDPYRLAWASRRPSWHDLFPQPWHPAMLALVPRHKVQHCPRRIPWGKSKSLAGVS